MSNEARYAVTIQCDSSEEAFSVAKLYEGSSITRNSPSVAVYNCEQCGDTGQIPVGTSGSELDGNAIEYEQCYCKPVAVGDGLNERVVAILSYLISTDKAVDDLRGTQPLFMDMRNIAGILNALQTNAGATCEDERVDLTPGPIQHHPV